MPNTTEGPVGPAAHPTARPTARRARTVAAVALAAVALAVAGSACSSSKSSGSATTSTTSPEDRIASDAEVAAGLAQIQALTADAVQQLATDQAAAKQTVEQAYTAWYEIEGAVKQKDTSAYLDVEDSLGALKNAVDQHDAEKAAQAQQALVLKATTILGPTASSTTTTTS